MKIYLVVLIIQLKLYSNKKDSFDRIRNYKLLLVLVDKQEEANEYIIDRLLDKKIVRGKAYYLIK